MFPNDFFCGSNSIKKYKRRNCCMILEPDSRAWNPDPGIQNLESGDGFQWREWAEWFRHRKVTQLWAASNEENHQYNSLRTHRIANTQNRWHTESIRSHSRSESHSLAVKVLRIQFGLRWTVFKFKFSLYVKRIFRKNIILPLLLLLLVSKIQFFCCMLSTF